MYFNILITFTVPTALTNFKDIIELYTKLLEKKKKQQLPKKYVYSKSSMALLDIKNSFSSIVKYTFW